MKEFHGMTWNYRLIRYPAGGVGIHEVYYDGHGKVMFWTERAITVWGATKQECLESYIQMDEAFRKPILSLARLEKNLRT